MTLRYDEIADILRMIDDSSCDELIIETADLKLVVRRRGAGGAAIAPLPPSTTGTARPPAAARASKTPPAPAPTTDMPAGVAIRSPMVGTFYRAPKPDAPPFVEIGSHVEPGAPLCVIDVMKLFTTITAETAGKIVYIGGENSTLVEFGQVLFVIDPAA